VELIKRTSEGMGTRWLDIVNLFGMRNCSVDLTVAGVGRKPEATALANGVKQGILLSRQDNLLMIMTGFPGQRSALDTLSKCGAGYLIFGGSTAQCACSFGVLQLIGVAGAYS
jgi:hypothetical protein